MKQSEIFDAFKSIEETKLSSVGGRKRRVLKEHKDMADIVIKYWDDRKVLEKHHKYMTRNHEFEETNGILNLLMERIKELRLTSEYRDSKGEVIQEGSWIKDLNNGFIGQDTTRVMKDEKGLYVLDEEEVNTYLWELETETDFEVVPLQEGTDDAQVEETAEAGTEVGIEPTDEGTAGKVTEKKKPGAKPTRKVGDIHKNGKWVWTEYTPGKFDWRTIPSQKKKPGNKPGYYRNGHNNPPRHDA